MSITGALSNALTGLTAASRATEVISSNIANVMTEGYGRRQLDLSARTLGPNGTGVWIDGVSRQVDQVVISSRRLADAAAGDAGTRARYLERIEAAIGMPDDAGSLSARLAELETSLQLAASRPDSSARLQGVFTAAQSLSDHINDISNRIQSLRMEADGEIAAQVAQVNSALQRLEQLNIDIVAHNGAGYDANGLIDQRQQLIDSIASIIPVRQIEREYGRIALISEGGAVLLDGPAATLGFDPVGVIVPEMTISSGGLNGLTLNDRPIDMSGTHNPMRGGSLAALFEVRDTITVNAQADLDAFARDLVERFQDPAADPTLASGQAGLFTDGGSPFSTANEIALSSRLQINALVNPAAGGALWKLRDGLGAASPGDIGNAVQLQRLADALDAARVPASGSYAGAARSAAGLGADFLSLIATQRQSVQSEAAYTSARQNALKAQELQGGVDTDQEMQQLLLAEQAFAANARVIQAADELIQTLLGI